MAARRVTAGLGRMPGRVPGRVPALALALALVLAACGSLPGDAVAPSSAVATTALPLPRPAVPAAGSTLFGVHLDWRSDSPAGFADRTGLSPAVYGSFAFFPLTADAVTQLRTKAALIRAKGAALFLTLEPADGLSTVTPDSAAATAKVLADVNATGVTVYLRFAHEMNGSWYAWGQQPAAYVAAFRTLAAAVHAGAKGTHLVWAPNYGSGYPFTGGRYAARPGTVDHARLDTDHDGRVTTSDDMYAPYYPGDDAVDWVGLSLYFFGLAYPWSENETAEPGRFAAQLTGTYHGAYGDERALPDFYTEFAVGHRRPMVVAETAAWFNTQRVDGAPQQQVVQAWLDQVYAPSVHTRFPQVAMVNWFEQRKVEAEAEGVVDWRMTFQPAVLADLKEHLAAAPAGYVFAAG